MYSPTDIRHWLIVILITLSFENQPLGDILKKIGKENNISFAYSNDIAKLNVSGTYTKKQLGNVLDDLATQTNLEYKIIGRQIVFKKKGDQRPKQNIRGEVYDEHSHFGLPGATIKVIGSDPLIGAATATDGTFLLENLPIGRYNIEISFIGYQSRIEEVVVSAGKEVNVSIGLIEEINKLQEIVVSAYENKVVPTNQMAVVSARSISVEETQRFAGSLSDPARMALSYAGVTSSNGYTNEIIVRGNSPHGLLWRLEGIEVPNPNHYAVEGSSGGFINILNSNNMARSDFFVSAFPAEFGNATSGIFDLRMRKGNADEKEHSLEVASLGLRASTEGPIGKTRGSYLVNYRYSTLGLLGNFLKSYDFPVFQDITFKLNLPTINKGTFSVFGIGGTGKWDQESSVGYFDANQEVVRKTWHDVQHYDLGILGVNHTYSFKNKKTYLETVAALSATQNRPSSSDFNYDIMEPYLEERGKYINSAYRLTSTLNHKFNASNLITTGLKFNYLKYNLRSENGLPDGTITRTLEKSGDANLAQGFVSWQLRPSDDWVINSGLHVTYFSLSQQLLPEPRLGIEHHLNARQSLSFGAGLHSRHESVATYYGESIQNGEITYPNQHLKLSRAAHFVVGYNIAFTDNLHLKAETYWQHQFSIPVENDPQSSYSSINNDISFTTQELVNKGIGKNYGIELTLEKNYANQFYFLITGSLFDAKYKALDGIWRNTRYNTGYAINLIGGKEFDLGRKKEKNRALGINLRGALTGGKRVTPIDLDQSIANGYQTELPELAYSKQLSDYYRLDFSIYYKWERAKTSHQLKVDILNLLEQNVYGIRYVQAKPNQPASIQEYSFNEEDEVQSNTFPIFSYKVNF
jgi:CarboxypepD_reg-like domain/Domain of unknown function (DUF4974)